MGSVYEVKQVSTGRRRALKVMKPELVVDDALRYRFAQEAKITSIVQSEHVVDVVAAGIEGDTPWIVMELLDGEDLGTRLERGALSFDETRAILVQVGAALTVAHAAHVVHRDLKPENIFLCGPSRSRVKILDFGIAKIVAAATVATVQNTEALGSPIWMAPEQMELGMVSPASDIWSLGLLAFTMLTGKVFWKAFGQSNVHRIFQEVLTEALPPASVRAAELGVPGKLPPWFDAWFTRCVDRLPISRFKTATEALTAFSAPVTPTRKRSVLPFVSIGLLVAAVAVGTYFVIPRLTRAEAAPATSTTLAIDDGPAESPSAAPTPIASVARPLQLPPTIGHPKGKVITTRPAPKTSPSYNAVDGTGDAWHPVSTPTPTPSMSPPFQTPRGSKAQF